MLAPEVVFSTMGDSDDASGTTVPVVCERCGTDTRVPLDEVDDVIEHHNERLHDGEPAATIDPMIRDELAALVAEELDLL